MVADILKVDGLVERIAWSTRTLQRSWLQEAARTVDGDIADWVELAIGFTIGPHFINDFKGPRWPDAGRMCGGDGRRA